MIRDPEALINDSLEVDALTAHHAVDPRSEPVSTICAGSACCAVERRLGLPRRQLSFSPVGPCAFKPCTQSRSVYRSVPPILAASARLILSSTIAIDSSRWLWFASFVEVARRRSCDGVWLGLISTTLGMAQTLNFTNLNLGIPG